MDSTKCKVVSQDIAQKPESLFEHCHWLYALCREYLFRDHTPEIVKALFPSEAPSRGTHVLELGCGPGLYASRLAQQYPEIETAGVDMSKRLIRWARSRAARLHLDNCNFFEGDAQALPDFPHEVDAVIVSRLFLIVPDKKAVLAEIHRILRPGGRCFITEPTSSFATRLPLRAMWLLARLTRNPVGKYLEPQHVDVMSCQEFRKLIEAQPWESVEIHQDDWYQSAICVKSSEVSSTDASAA